MSGARAHCTGGREVVDIRSARPQGVRARGLAGLWVFHGRGETIKDCEQKGEVIPMSLKR